MPLAGRGRTLASPHRCLGASPGAVACGCGGGGAVAVSSPVPVSKYLKALRAKVGRDLILVPGAAALVRDKAGRVLLERRTDNGEWGLPGGAADPGEAPAQTAVRETFEETGLKVKPELLAGVVKGHTRYPNGDSVEMTLSVFECRVVAGSMESRDGESLEFRYFGADELPASSMLEKYPPELFAEPGGGCVYSWDDAWLEGLAPGSRDTAMISSYHRQLRDRIGSELFLTPCAFALVRDAQGRVLLQRRADTGRWGLPGGMAEPREAPALTAAREAFEETGLKARPTRVIGVYGGIRHRFQYATSGDWAEVHGVLFELEAFAGELDAADGESEELAFFDPARPPPKEECMPILRRSELVSLLARESPHFVWDDAWLKGLDPDVADQGGGWPG